MNKKYLASFIFLLVAILLPAFAFAEDLGITCATIAESTNGCPGLGSAECKVQLQKCADYYDQQSNLISQDLTKTAQQKKTLSSAISGLEGKISGLEAQISKSNVMVKDLNIQISDTHVSINKTTDQIYSSQEQIKNILRAIYEEDKKPSFAILLEGSLSDFFSNVAYLESLNKKISGLLDSTINLKIYLEGQQVKMSDNVDQLQRTIALQSVQKKENEQNKKQQEQYLKLTETQYQQQLKKKEAVASKA